MYASKLGGVFAKVAQIVLNIMYTNSNLRWGMQKGIHFDLNAILSGTTQEALQNISYLRK